MKGQCLCHYPCALTYQPHTSSVRAHIRDRDVNFSLTAQSWPLFCYSKYTCDIDDIESGLFRGSMLVKVRFISLRRQAIIISFN